MSNCLYRSMKKSEILEELEKIKNILEAKSIEELNAVVPWVEAEDERYLSSYLNGIAQGQIDALIKNMKEGVFNTEYYSKMVNRHE